MGIFLLLSRPWSFNMKLGNISILLLDLKSLAEEPHAVELHKSKDTLISGNSSSLLYLQRNQTIIYFLTKTAICSCLDLTHSSGWDTIFVIYYNTVLGTLVTISFFCVWFEVKYMVKNYSRDISRFKAFKAKRKHQGLKFPMRGKNMGGIWLHSSPDT